MSRPNHILQIDKELVYEFPIATATIQHKLITLQRRSRITLVEIINPTGLAGHASNYWDIDLIQATSTVIARWTTDSDVVAQGTLGVNTVHNLELSATDANRVVPAGVLVSLLLTKAAAAANLPLGRIAVHYTMVD